MVDNNSTDMSAEIVKRYSRLKLVSERKQGAYAARNRGIREAQGGIITFTDADCAPAPDWLKEIESAMTDSHVGIVVGGYQSAGNSFFLSMLEDYENEKNNYIFNSDIKELYYGYTRNMAVRKSLFIEMGPFAERARGSDVIFIQRCVDRDSCTVVRYAPQVRVRHMEVENPRRYFQKVFIYGNSSQQYRQIVSARPLTVRERFLVFRRTVQSQRYSRIKSLFLFALLAIGFFYWAMGSMVATWSVEQEPTT
jgi:glycosyltransferase involved in cell wall biosynthesis